MQDKDLHELLKNAPGELTFTVRYTNGSIESEESIKAPSSTITDMKAFQDVGIIYEAFRMLIIMVIRKQNSEVKS